MRQEQNDCWNSPEVLPAATAAAAEPTTAAAAALQVLRLVRQDLEAETGCSEVHPAVEVAAAAEPRVSAAEAATAAAESAAQ